MKEQILLSKPLPLLKNREGQIKLFELLRGRMDNEISEDVEITKRIVKKKI